jgi:hypothetical protein
MKPLAFMLGCSLIVSCSQKATPPTGSDAPPAISPILDKAPSTPALPAVSDKPTPSGAKLDALGALSRAQEAIRRSECVSDISGLSIAVANFKSTFEARYLPSRIKLSETGNYDMNKPLDRESAMALVQVFGTRFEPKSKNDWNGNGKIDQPDQSGDVVLEGDQCLVFFLGGIKGKGFSTSARNPASDSQPRHPPFFDFPQDRLAPNGNEASKLGYLSFRDVYGKNFYAYFTTKNGLGDCNTLGDTDCPTLSVWPYVSALKPMPRYLNSTSFQILCAGPDGKFGQGSVLPDGLTWSADEPDKTYPPGSDGADDMSNFYSKPLGSK